MARNVYGLDLGTYEIKVFDKNKNEIWKEKNVIAMKDEKYIFSVGDEAYEMYEKAPDNIQVVFPMKEGVISHFDDMQYLLQNLLNKERQFARGSEYVIAVPTDVTEVEKRAFYDLLMHSSAKAREVKIVERGIADAVGLGLDVEREKGIFIANFGGETTELSVLSSGGMVLNRLVKMGGVQFDLAVANLVRRSKDFLIGRLTAEVLRREFGVFDQENDATLKVAGRNLITGVPRQKEIPIGLVRAAIKDPLEEIVRAIQEMVDRLPPDIRRIIDVEGIFITGGLANLRGLDTYLREVTGLRVRKAKRPDVCAVEGIRKIILNKELKHLAYSMLDEDYRWLR
ncbi:rod shape-determining protein [Hespellia stercorisuis]|uniref:Cell shape-determining protein MreB n=1 Tax=Hespellia stercorisuis DSM 15480 TaxID=1121950 RepID=A0A1M6N3Q7_9FIRM|nr:rod shape-determining protein [Hespellia stercorisuis]SHJ90324.1 rod shape-determining protein MreB [Hespellia stercorisuis DSM 15480]